MKETKRPSDEEKKQEEEKSTSSTFLQSIKGFVSKLDPDKDLKDGEPSKDVPEKTTSSGTKTVLSESSSTKSDDSKDSSSTSKLAHDLKPESQRTDPSLDGDESVSPQSSSKSQDKTKEASSSPSKEENKSETDKSEKSSEQLPLITLFHRVEEKFSSLLKSDRKRMIRIGGLILAALFIILGAIVLFGSADKVTDNVISGERAVTSAFLIIIGLLIIAGVLAPNLVEKTSFDNLYKEVKVVEGKPSSENEKDAQTKKEKNSKDIKDKTDK